MVVGDFIGESSQNGLTKYQFGQPLKVNMQGLSILLIGMRIAGHDRSISLYSGKKNL